MQVRNQSENNRSAYAAQSSLNVFLHMWLNVEKNVAPQKTKVWFFLFPPPPSRFRNLFHLSAVLLWGFQRIGKKGIIYEFSHNETFLCHLNYCEDWIVCEGEIERHDDNFNILMGWKRQCYIFFSCFTLISQ